MAGDAPEPDDPAAGDLPEGIAPGDIDAVVDDLVAAGVLVETDDGGLFLTEEFDATRGIYHDSYVDADDERIRETLADLFDLDPETAAERATEVTREELVAFLSLRSFLDDPPPADRLGLMAGAVAGITPESSVPDALAEVDDGSYRAHLADAPDSVVTVWKRHCDPCEAMKGDLDEVLAAVPDGVPVVGLDGEDCPEFCGEFGVNAAPAVCCFRDGDPVETLAGRRSPESLSETFADVYGSDGG